jgi:hypothetical protein
VQHVVGDDRWRRERSRLTVRAVAERAGVSATFLYENADARALVKNGVIDSRSRHDHAGREEHERIEGSWRERALNAEAQLTRTQKEIFTQRQRIGELSPHTSQDHPSAAAVLGHIDGAQAPAMTQNCLAWFRDSSVDLAWTVPQLEQDPSE